EVGDSNLLAQKVAELCEDAALYNSASHYSVNRAKLYTIDKFREGYYGIYQQLCTDK
ncbi:glycosyltransferase, partial [Vibrio alginolyticus]|nr:glycosyltransferase [Vibrio alginolyticus]MDW2088934.1 glycosyltransferase [Vibrio sp. 2134-1]